MTRFLRDPSRVIGRKIDISVKAVSEKELGAAIFSDSQFVKASLGVGYWRPQYLYAGESSTGCEARPFADRTEQVTVIRRGLPRTRGGCGGCSGRKSPLNKRLARQNDSFDLTSYRFPRYNRTESGTGASDCQRSCSGRSTDFGKEAERILGSVEQIERLTLSGAMSFFVA